VWAAVRRLACGQIPEQEGAGSGKSGWGYWNLKRKYGLPMQVRPLQWFNFQAYWTVPPVKPAPRLCPALSQAASSSTPQDCRVTRRDWPAQSDHLPVIWPCHPDRGSEPRKGFAERWTEI
jgi:hypothetical protein